MLIICLQNQFNIKYSSNILGIIITIMSYSCYIEILQLIGK